MNLTSFAGNANLDLRIRVDLEARAIGEADVLGGADACRIRRPTLCTERVPSGRAELPGGHAECTGKQDEHGQGSRFEQPIGFRARVGECKCQAGILQSLTGIVGHLQSKTMDGRFSVASGVGRTPLV